VANEIDGPLPRAWSVSRADPALAILTAARDPAPVGDAVTIAA
jgi:hypothetical protein